MYRYVHVKFNVCIDCILYSIVCMCVFPYIILCGYILHYFTFSEKEKLANSTREVNLLRKSPSTFPAPPPSPLLLLPCAAAAAVPLPPPSCPLPPCLSAEKEVYEREENLREKKEIYETDNQRHSKRG